MEKPLPRSGDRRRRAGWLAVVVSLVASLLGAAVVAAAPASAATCGCRDTGPYTTPTRKAPVRGETSPDGGVYRLTVTQNGNNTTLAITRAATAEPVLTLHDVPIGRIQYGFSPDGNRFVVSHQDQDTQRDEVALYDLIGKKRVFLDTVNAGHNMSFSPHGRWFMLSSLSSTTTSDIVIVDAASGTPALSTSIGIETIPGDEGDKFGIINGGFSSDAADTSFAYAFRQRNGGSILLNQRNLVTKRDTLSIPVGDAHWYFSPCGDVLGLVNQTAEHVNTVAASLHSTTESRQVGQTQFFAPIPADISFDSTLDFHRVKTTGFDGVVKFTNIAPNGASEGCTTTPAVDSVSLEPTTVVGGQRNPTGTVRLTSSTSSSLVVTLRSSDTSVATVPSSVTVLSGGSSKTFTVTTRAVTTTKTVTISATAGGVTQSVTLTVTPPPPAPGGGLDAVTIDPDRVAAGQQSIGTVTLTEPAGAGGVTVALSSNRPDLASVPASVLVPAGATSATFPITTGTSAVVTDSPATITAEHGTYVRTARITVLVADRACSTSSSDPDTDLMKARAFGAYDDAHEDVDCGAVAEIHRGLVVGAGTTGLEKGAPVRLQITMRFDGTLASTPPVGSGAVVTDAATYYRITDPMLSDPEGGVPALAEFHADYSLNHIPVSLGGDYAWYASSSFTTNTIEAQTYYDRGEAQSDEAVVMAMDTGTYVAEYETTVGAHLLIDARLSTFATAHGDGASALSDFSNTFRAQNAPAPGFEGLELILTDAPPETPENRAPLCADGHATTTQGVAVDGQLDCSDPDGDPIGYIVASPPVNGTLSGPSESGAFTYTPAVGFSGTDSFSFRATDGALRSSTQTFTIEVEPAAPTNTAPVCSDSTLTTAQDTPGTGTVACTDADGDALTYTVVGAPAHGTLSAIAADGSFTYTPVSGYSGADSFAVTANDGRGGQATARFTVQVTAAPAPTLRPGTVHGGGTLTVPGSNDRIVIAPEVRFDGKNAVGVLNLHRTGRSSVMLSEVSFTGGGTWRSGSARFAMIKGNATMQSGKTKEKVTFEITVADDRTDTVWITVRRQNGSVVNELSTAGVAPDGGQPLSGNLNVTVL